MDIKGSAALVTGGAVRIGRAIVEALAERGCTVLVHYSRSRVEAEVLVRAVRARGGTAHALRGNLERPAACAKLIAQAQSRDARLNILINNAAVFHKESLAEMTAASLQREFQINLFAPMLLTQAFAAAVARRHVPGHVVNIVDRRVATHEAGCIPYLLSKKALADFTRSAALELAPAIAVNAIAPGAVLPPPGKGAAAIRELAGRAPLRHRCQPRDVARAVAFLLESEGITGQTIFVDSGQHLQGAT